MVPRAIADRQLFADFAHRFGSPMQNVKQLADFALVFGKNGGAP
jgi:hypothetical protein